MRVLIRTAIVAAAIGSVTACGAPAQAVDIFIEVNPATVQAGSSVTIRASCGDTVTSAAVRSDAFGSVTAIPHDGYLTATAGVPPDREPGTYTVRLTCPNGRSANTTVVVLGGMAPVRGPHTGGGALASAAGSPSPSRRLIVGGLALVGLGSLLGAYALRRRRVASRT